MSDEEITFLIDKELKEKTLGVTEQYLEIHRPLYTNGKLKIERIDREREDNVVIAYLPVAEEVFFFTVFVDTSNSEIINMGTESFNKVYFHASSENLSKIQLESICSLAATEGRNKGDLRGLTGLVKYKYSYVNYLPNPEPDSIVDKLEKLLNFLEEDKEGVRRLVEEANGYIQVAMDIHNANGMIGGPFISRKMVERMNNLGLAIDFDLYVGGNSFLEHN